MKKAVSTSVEPLVEYTPEGPSNRSFGYTVGGILLCLGLGKWLMAGSPTPVSIGFDALGATLVVLAVISPEVLTIPNQLWAKFGLLLSKIVNPIVMLLIYVTAFVPIGLFLRLRGHDPLAASFDRTAVTYWIARRPREPEPSTMRNQF